MIPERIGRYQVQELLGCGGMGRVYKAWDDELSRWVAIKTILHADGPSAGRTRLRRQLRREARTAAAINHSAVAQIYDLLGSPDCDYLVLEYVDGVSLGELLRQGPIELPQALRIGLDVAEGLQAAHARGIVHRDLKPGNVLVTTAGRAKILDFGLSLAGDRSEAGLEQGLAGTLSAMSPEQLEQGDIGPRSDLFSLGSLLYQLLTGSHPFRGGLPPTTMDNILRRLPPPPHEVDEQVPEEISRLVIALLAKRARDRPGDAEVIATLGRHCAGLPQQPQPPKGGRRWLAAVAATVAVVGLVASWWLAGAEPLPQPRAVVVLEPEVADDQQGRYTLVASGVRSAVENALGALAQVYPITPSRQDAAAGAPLAVARATAAHEALTSELACSRHSCRVVLRRIDGKEGHTLWTSTFQVPSDNLQLLTDTVTAVLTRAYPGHRVRNGAFVSLATPGDYQSYLEVRRLVRERRSTVLWADLLERLAEIRRSSPRLLDAHTLTASTAAYLYRVNRDKEILRQAEQAVDDALALAADDPRALLAEIDVALAGNDLARAERSLTALAAIDPYDPRLRRFQARMAERRGEMKTALALLREAVQERPSAVRLLILAGFEMRNGLISEARGHLEQGMQRSPHDLRLLTRLAELELTAGSPHRAEELYLHLLDSSYQEDLLSNLGAAQLLLGRYQEAATNFQVALRYGSWHPFTQLNLADCHQLLGRTAEAQRLRRDLLQRLDAAPTPPSVADLQARAQCLAHLGQAAAAAVAIEQALQLRPDSPTAHYSASLTYALLDDNERCRFSAERALALGINPHWFALPWFEGRGIDTTQSHPG